MLLRKATLTLKCFWEKYILNDYMGFLKARNKQINGILQQQNRGMWRLNF